MTTRAASSSLFLPDLFVVPVAEIPAVPTASEHEEKTHARVGPLGCGLRQDLPRSGHGVTTAPFRKGSHSSWTGAQAQTLPIYTAKQSALLQMLANGQPLTRNQLALFLHWPLSSVCSVLNSVRDKLDMVGYESYDWGEGRITRRERFQVKHG